MRLKDKVAIVTGGGAGVGEAIAMQYAREGARVVVAETVPARGQSAVDAIHKLGGESIFVQTDVSSEERVKEMVETTLLRFGRIDILVNNAAILIAPGDTRAHELTNEVWERTIDTNLRGYWLCAKYTIPSMLSQGGGCNHLSWLPDRYTRVHGLRRVQREQGRSVGTDAIDGQRLCARRNTCECYRPRHYGYADERR